MSMYLKLAAIQSELKVPKSNWNDFSKYHYRSCEDILEAVKPFLESHKLYLTLSDDAVLIGEREIANEILRRDLYCCFG